MSQNQALPLTLQRPQYHDFTDIDLSGAVAGSLINKSMTIYCPFPVKELKFSVSYWIQANQAASFVMSMPSMVPEAQIVSTLMKGVSVIGGAYYYSDAGGASNEVRYIFREPRVFNGSYDVILRELTGGNPTLTTSRALLHLECLG